jgi:hypothetical protein
MSALKRKEAESDRQEQAHSARASLDVESLLRELPVYTRKELEEKLEKLQEIINDIATHYTNIEKELGAIVERVFDAHEYSRPPYWRFYEFYDEVKEKNVDKMREIEDYIHDLIRDLVVVALDLDPDYEKWEEIFDRTFYSDYWVVIGLATVREESGELVPVVVVNDYDKGLMFIPVDEL